MNKKSAGSSVVGYSCLFIAGWLVSMFNAHWFSLPMLHSGMMLVMILGGVVLALAGIFSFINGNTLETALFLVFGALLSSLALSSVMFPKLNEVGSFSGFAGWVFILFAAFVFCLWIASFGEGFFRNLFLLGLWLTMLALAVGNWAYSTGIIIVGGYLGLITSLLAGYVSAEGIINSHKSSTPASTGEPSVN